MNDQNERTDPPNRTDDHTESDGHEGPISVDSHSAEAYLAAADRSLSDAYEEPMSLAEYVEAAFADPEVAAHASKYLVEAIETAGTRTVIEEGEEKRRYRFFDDPHNDGEHAILGNTEVLNAFVDDLRSIAAGRAKAEKIIWLEGPTATGKSELKRCLINGLSEYSKTPDGRRYTVEWNVAGAGATSKMTYGDGYAGDEDDWYTSPVQSHPLSVFPEDVREELLEALNEGLDETAEITVRGRLDPFCREAYDILAERYRREGVEDRFSAVTAPEHFRVRNYVVGVGRGIGVLHAEDDGTPKERLVGSWMNGMVRELGSRGRKNPQAFSYDGVLSQGNGLLTIVEDAAQHADLLRKLLNVPDERSVKLDKGIEMDIDTQLLIISNPDLEAQLNQHASREGQDPLKALKRRLDKREFTYLTNLSLETELLVRELTGETEVWDAEDYDELEARIRKPVTVRVREGRKPTRERRENDGPIESERYVGEREFAPHTLEAAALYSVVTRLGTEDLPAGLDVVDKALLFDRGELRQGDERVPIERFGFDENAADGDGGIPVTFTRDVLGDLLYEERDRAHPDLAVEDVITPEDVLDAMADGLADAPVFSPGERNEFENRVVPVKNHLVSLQEADVLDAMLREHRVEEETVESYVEQVYAWAGDEQVETDRGESVDPDPLEMKVFEIEHLGRFDEENYEGERPSPAVERFRTEKIITALNRHAWENRNEAFQVGDVALTEIPIIESVLGTHDWEDVRRVFEDFDPRQWEDPPRGTRTEAVKERTIENMTELFEYSEAAAELASRHVMEQVSYQWN